MNYTFVWWSNMYNTYITVDGVAKIFNRRCKVRNVNKNIYIYFCTCKKEIPMKCILLSSLKIKTLDSVDLNSGFFTWKSTKINKGSYE